MKGYRAPLTPRLPRASDSPSRMLDGSTFLEINDSSPFVAAHFTRCSLADYRHSPWERGYVSSNLTSATFNRSVAKR